MRYIIMNATVTVPNLSEITLEQYQRFLKVQQINKEDDYVIQLKMIEIFCNVEFKDARNIKFKDVERIIEKLTQNFKEKPDLIKRFKMDGVEYGFIPNLQDISFGEYIDIDTYLPQEDQMHLAMNVLYRPVKNKKAGKYSIEDYDINAKDRMKQMPLSVMLSAAFFLQNLGMELLNVTSNYLQKEVQKQQASPRGLGKNGDGIQASMRSLKEILNDLKISLPLN